MATVLLVAVLAFAVLGPPVWGERAGVIDPDALSQGSSAAHWFGTDGLGRDIFSRVLVATRLSVALALLATVIGISVGITLGAAPWLLGRRLGRVVTAAVNIAVAMPYLLLTLFFAVVFGVGFRGAVLAIGLAMAPYYARVTQTLVAGIQQRDYAAAARIAGVGKVKTLLRHILPNIGEPLIVNATVSAGGALLAFAGLSFLGLGVQPPYYDWGLLLNEGLAAIYLRPGGALAPGAAIVIAGLAFNLFGEVVAKRLGLRTARVHTSSAYRSAPTVRTCAPPDDVDATPATGDEVLAVEDLWVTIPTTAGDVTPVRGVSFTVSRGEAVGVVGESGSGKSFTAMAAAQLVEMPMRVDATRLTFLGNDMRAAPTPEVNRVLGTSLGVVFQDPTSSLNPTMRVGVQLAEITRRHLQVGRRRALADAVARLRAVRVPAAQRRVHQYPHEFSGGMRQRAMLAMALMGTPALIVADEPTTALDVTVQRQVLQLLHEIRVDRDVAVLLISHDITVIGQMCDRVLVMYAGRVVEDLPASALQASARHPYTRALLAAVPDLAADRDRRLATIPGRPVDLTQLPTGCAFAARCPLADEQCTAADPPLVADGSGQRVACWHAGETIPKQDDQGAEEAVS